MCFGSTGDSNYEEPNFLNIGTIEATSNNEFTYAKDNGWEESWNWNKNNVTNTYYYSTNHQGSSVTLVSKSFKEGGKKDHLGLTMNINVNLKCFCKDNIASIDFDDKVSLEGWDTHPAKSVDLTHLADSFQMKLSLLSLIVLLAN